MNTNKTVFFATAVILFIVGIIFLVSSYESIDEGERGLVTRFGKVVKVVEPGMQYVGALNDVTKFQTRNAKYDAVASAGTIDLQTVTIDVSVNYQIDKNAIADIYATFGKDYISRIFTQNVQESVKSVSSRYQASELVTKRDQFKSEVTKKLTDTVNKYVIITDVTINNIDFSDSFDAAVNAKVIAEQNAAEARNKVETARAEAEAVKLRAQAIQASGGAEYVQLEAIKKWDGKLPTTIMSGTVPFINIK